MDTMEQTVSSDCLVCSTTTSVSVVKMSTDSGLQTTVLDPVGVTVVRLVAVNSRWTFTQVHLL